MDFKFFDNLKSLKNATREEVEINKKFTPSSNHEKKLSWLFFS